LRLDAPLARPAWALSSGVPARPPMLPESCRVVVSSRRRSSARFPSMPFGSITNLSFISAQSGANLRNDEIPVIAARRTRFGGKPPRGHWYASRSMYTPRAAWLRCRVPPSQSSGKNVKPAGALTDSEPGVGLVILGNLYWYASTAQATDRPAAPQGAPAGFLFLHDLPTRFPHNPTPELGGGGAARIVLGSAHGQARPRQREVPAGCPDAP